MNVETHLQEQSTDYLVACFHELEKWRSTGVLPEGHIREIHERFNSSTTQLYMTGELIYRELAKLYVKEINGHGA